MSSRYNNALALQKKKKRKKVIMKLIQTQKKTKNRLILLSNVNTITPSWINLYLIVWVKRMADLHGKN